MNFEDTLRKALQADAAELVPVGPGPDDARRRAHRRRRRVQAGIVSVSAVALVGASLAIVDSRSSGQAPRVQAQPPAASQPTPELVWRSVDGTVGYDTAHFTTADGVTYALSTAPGATPSSSGVNPQELYATHNGVDWTHTSLGPTPWVVDFTASNGVLYAVGTAPGQRAATYKLSTSSDGGANWNDTELPVSFTPPSASVALTPSTTVKVARGPHTTVVIATATYTPDISSAVGGKAWIASDSGGVQIIDAQACKLAREGGTNGVLTSGESPCTRAIETKPWSDFGISDPAALHQQAAVVRDDGGSWHVVPLANEQGTWVQDVAATSNGFLIAESVASVSSKTVSERLLASPDGRTWTPLNSVPPIDQVSIWGDRVIGMNSPSGTLYTSNDAGTTWTAGTALSSVVGGTSSVQVVPGPIDVGPLGYAIVAQNPTAPSRTYLLYSTDGNEWNKTDVAAVGAPANGSFSSMNVGADHIDVTFLDPVYGAANTPISWKLTTLVGTPKA